LDVNKALETDQLKEKLKNIKLEVNAKEKVNDLAMIRIQGQLKFSQDAN
jgi:hypothetical protein